MEELHVGDKVKLIHQTGIKSYDGLVWEVMSNPWSRFGTKVVTLAAYPGGPVPDEYLKKVSDE